MQNYPYFESSIAWYEECDSSYIDSIRQEWSKVIRNPDKYVFVGSDYVLWAVKLMQSQEYLAWAICSVNEEGEKIHSLAGVCSFYRSSLLLYLQSIGYSIESIDYSIDFE